MLATGTQEQGAAATSAALAAQEETTKQAQYATALQGVRSGDVNAGQALTQVGGLNQAANLQGQAQTAQNQLAAATANQAANLQGQIQTGNQALTAQTANQAANLQAQTTTGTQALTAEQANQQAGLTAQINTGQQALTAGTANQAANLQAQTTTGAQALNAEEANQAANLQAQQGTLTGAQNAYTQTLAAGGGVTLPTALTIPGFSLGQYFGTVGGTAASPTVTFTHISTVPIRSSDWVSNPQATALVTVGAGTITAAGIAGGVTARGGTQTAIFTDTTDTVANILAGVPSLSTIGASVPYRYVNNTIWTATIQGASGVTITGATVVPPNSWIDYLVTYSGAGAIAMVATAQGYFPNEGTVTLTSGAGTVANAAVTAASNITLTLKTPSGTVAAPFVKTITAGTGFTVGGGGSDNSTYNYEIRG